MHDSANLGWVDGRVDRERVVPNRVDVDAGSERSDLRAEPARERGLTYREAQRPSEEGGKR